MTSKRFENQAEITNIIIMNYSDANEQQSVATHRANQFIQQKGKNKKLLPQT